MRCQFAVPVFAVSGLVAAGAVAQLIDPEDEGMPEAYPPGKLPSPQLDGPLSLSVTCADDEPVLHLTLSSRQRAFVHIEESHDDSSVVFTLSADWNPPSGAEPLYLPDRDSLIITYVYHTDSAVFLLARDSTSACSQLRVLRPGPFIRLTGRFDGFGIRKGGR